MASLLALTRARRGLHPSFNVTRQVAHSFQSKRCLHQTPIAWKRLKQAAREDDDLFSSDMDDSLFPSASEDLFSSSAAKSASAKSTPAKSTVAKSAVRTSGSVTPKTSRSRGLNPERRLQRFNELYKFLSDRIGLKPVTTSLQVRKTAWQHLFSLATTKEQLEQVTELFPKWRDSRRPFTPRIAETFVRRCEELHCPTLALRVFSDHSKYGLDLNSLTAARHLMHALHVEHPLEDTITLVALYKLYNLPPISKDLVSCAMLTSACFKRASPQSLTVANALVPELKELLEKTNPKEMGMFVQVPTQAKRSDEKPKTKVKVKNIKVKERAWLAWTLNKIEKALANQNMEMGWLKKWREQSGYAQLTT